MTFLDEQQENLNLSEEHETALNLPSDLPEDRTVLGIQVVPAAKRAGIKLLREKQDIDKIKAQFDISTKVIQRAHSLPQGERRNKYLDNVTTSIERVFPGSSKRIRMFAEDKEGFQQVSKQLSNPKTRAIFNAHLESGDPTSAMDYIEGLYKKTGGSEFERLVAEQELTGELTPKQVKEAKKKRVGVLSGLEMRKGTEESLSFRKRKQSDEFTLKLRKEANKGTEHFSNMETNISDALAIMDSGDNQLVDSTLAALTSQITDPDIRAMALFTKFDPSYGNVVERTISGINRFITGTRTDSDKAIIKETLENFRDAHVKPGINKLKTQYRNMAAEEGYDPFAVVPVKYDTCDTEIRDYPGLTRDEKLSLMQKYCSHKFR